MVIVLSEIYIYSPEPPPSVSTLLSSNSV
jgi:hypothetical protein